MLPNKFKTYLFLLFFLMMTPLAGAVDNDGPKPEAAADSPKLTEYYQSGEITLPPELADVRQMTMSEAIRMALEENLELQAATFGARAAAAVHKGAYSLYDPVLSASYLEGENDEQLNSLFFAATTGSVEYSQASFSLLQKLPIGTELTIAGIQRKDDTVPTPTINPAYDTEASLGLLQPLLKGFGTTVTTQQIIFAAKDKEIALQDLRSAAFDLVAEVRNAYFEALQFQYELSYRESSVELARRIVRENVARVEAGILPPVEKLEAEVGLQGRERNLLDAQRAFADALDRFNLLLNNKDVPNLPIIEPFKMSFQPVEEDGIKSGLLKRPDINRRLMEIEKIRTEHSIAKNALLPELDLLASYNLNGLADSSSDSLDIATDADYDGWEVGVRFSYPLGSIESRNELKRTELALMQERSLLAQLHNEVRNEVRSAIRNINVSRKKTEVAKRGHDLALEKLRILLKSREVGLSTTRDVLEGEDDLAIARTEQISSVAEYFKAVTDYLQVTGTLLESEGIIFEGDVTPDLQRIPFYLR